MAQLEELRSADLRQPTIDHLAIQVASAVDQMGFLALDAVKASCAAWPQDPDFQERLSNAYANQGNSVLALEHAVGAIRLGSRSQAMIRNAAEGLALRPSDERRAWLLATLERWSYLGSSDRSWEGLLQDTLVTLGQRELAIERNLRQAKRYPDDLNPWIALLDKAVEGGAKTGEATVDLALGNIQRLEPANDFLLDLNRADQHPVEADAFFKAFAPDPEFAWLAAQGLEKSSTIEILDSGLVYLYPDGSRIGRVSVITKAEDRTGTEELHEIQAQGDPLKARVLKADGSTREPVLVQGAWAMPSLDPGDAVELEYEWRVSDDWGAPVDLGVWRFASSTRPFALSRYVVFVPKGLTLDVRKENFLGSHVTETWGGGTVHVLTSEKQPRIEAEPWMPSELEVLPVVHFAVDRTTHRMEQSWRALLQVALDLPLELEQGLEPWVAELDRELSPGEQARSLYLRLHEYLVEFDGGANPSEVWFAKRGQPILLLGALLERAQIPFEWGFFRKGMSPELDPAPLALYENLDENGALILRIPSWDEQGKEVIHWQTPPPRKGLGFGALPDTLGGGRGDNSRRARYPNRSDSTGGSG